MKIKFKCIDSSKSPYSFTEGKVYEFTHLGDCLTAKDDDGDNYYMHYPMNIEWEELTNDNQCQN